METTDKSFQEVLLGEARHLIEPLRSMAESELAIQAWFQRMGWTELAIGDTASLISGLAGLAEIVDELAEHPPQSLEESIGLLSKIGEVVESIRKIASFGGAFEEVARAAPEFFESLLLDYLATYHPHVYRSLALLTLITGPEAPGTFAGRIELPDGRVLRVAALNPRLRLDRLPDLLTDPIKTLGDYYFPKGFADGPAADAAADRLFPNIAAIVNGMPLLAARYGIPESYRAELDWGAFGNAMLRHMLCIYTPPGSFVFVKDGQVGEFEFGTTVVLVPPDRANGHPYGVAFGPFGSFDLTLDLGSGWQIGLALGAGIPSFVVGPGGFAFLEDGTDIRLSGKLSLKRLAGEGGAPAWLVGSATGTRFELASTSLGATIDLQGTTTDFGFLFNVEKAALVIAPGDGDGFLQKVLPKEGFRIDMHLAFGWSQGRGIYFDGGAGFEVTLPVHRSLLGVIEIDSVTISMAVAREGLKLGLGTSVGVKLGPVAASIEKMGLAASLAFKEGNLGPVDFGFGFKPPTGIGIVIDAGPITGGGFISFDFENQRYAGVLQLKLYSIGITAIGLLDTKLPGGQSGFSFLIIITVEFTPIQIGFGFTLNGVGGMAGINRTVMTQVLRDGLRNQALGNILFPRDPVKRATQLISDLRQIFPPAEGRYVFGPMLKVGWGTFVEATLGVIIEVPSPVQIILLGQLTVIMPRPEAAIVEIHLDVLGIIDFGEKLFSLDASLYNSRVAVFNISGDMALRLSWGEQPSFALSFGGLNPRFQPPPKFPTLRRLCISLGYGDNPRLSLEAYFAITSNSFQFGAALSLYVDLGILSIKGFLGFDALFIFRPFSFIIEFEAGLEVRIGSLKLLGIHLKAMLSGPTPWHIVGDASVSLLFFEISVHVDFTFGDEQREELPGVNPWPVLEAAILDQRNWSAVLPPAARSGVTFAAPEGAQAPVLIDPLGGAIFREKVVPLNQKLTKFGEAKPETYDEFRLDPVQVGRLGLKEPAHYALVEDHFAPGQFREMSDAEKISSPTFVDMVAGFSIASDAVGIGGDVPAVVEYTTSLIDGAAARRGEDYSLAENRMLRLAERDRPSVPPGAGLGKFARKPGQPAQVSVDAEAFVVVQKDDGTVREDVTPPVSKGRAQLALADYVAARPDEAGLLQVIPLSDLEIPV